MTGIGIALIALFASAIVFMIERCINHDHDPSWLMFIVVIGFGVLISDIWTYRTEFEVKKPSLIEKTSFLVAVRDNDVGVLTSDNISIWNANTNDVMIWQRRKYNVYGSMNEVKTGLGLKDEKVIAETIKMGVTNENSYVRK